MTDSVPPIEEVIDVIRGAATRVFAAVTTQINAVEKTDGSLLTKTDLALQDAIQQALQARWPTIGFFAEEMFDDTAALADFQVPDNAYWCLDPLDGTSNFANGFPVYAVSLALVTGGEVILAVVFDPVRDECFSAVRGRGAWLNQTQRLQCLQQDRPLKDCIALIDFKRLPENTAIRLATAPQYRSQRSIGSVALDWCWLAASRAQVYIHGRQSLWDYAAGALIFSESGGHARNFSGAPLDYSPTSPLSVVAASNASIYKQWSDYLALE